MPDCVLDYHIFRLDALVGIHVTSHNGPVDQERIKLFQGSPIVFFPFIEPLENSTMSVN